MPRTKAALVEEPVEAASGGFSPLDMAAEEIENYVGFSVLAEGEYTVELTGLTCRWTKKNRPAFQITAMPIVDDPDIRPGQVREFFNLPYPACTKAQRDAFTDHIAAFRLCFGIDNNELTELLQNAFQEMTSGDEVVADLAVGDYNGLRGSVILTVEEPEGYEPRNVIRRFVFDR